MVARQTVYFNFGTCNSVSEIIVYSFGITNRIEAKSRRPLKRLKIMNFYKIAFIFDFLKIFIKQIIFCY